MSVIPLGKETTFQALGQTWTTGTWSLAAWDELLAMARSYLPDPYDGLEQILPHVDRDMARELIMEAQKVKRRILSIMSPEIQEWLATVEGQIRLFYVLLKLNHPEVTLDMAMKIVSEVGDTKQAEIIDAAAGTPPAPKNTEARVA